MSKDDYPPVVQGVAMSEKITIEWLIGRTAPCPANNFAWTEEEADQIADLAISQHEEIERLKRERDDLLADLASEKNWHSMLSPCPQAMLNAVDEAYERAAQVCESMLMPSIIADTVWNIANDIRDLKAKP